MTDWKPIETAPKDGTEILAVEVSGHVPTVTIWGRSDFAVVHWDEIAGAWRDCSDLGAAGLDPFEPQYWMPLPEPPEDDPLATSHERLPKAARHVF